MSFASRDFRMKDPNVSITVSLQSEREEFKGESSVEALFLQSTMERARNGSPESKD
jgi:hypothetical protein